MASRALIAQVHQHLQKLRLSTFTQRAAGRELGDDLDVAADEALEQRLAVGHGGVEIHRLGLPAPAAG